MSIPLDSNGASMNDFSCKYECTWCDGCGDYGILTATKRALVELGIEPSQVLMCFDIGCHGNMSDKLLGYRFHGLHGRVIPLAAGATLANPDIPVLAFGGDGASFSEGVGHLVHAVRSHYDMTFILFNNGNYGLTTGQASAMTWQEQPMNTSPFGIPEDTLNSMDFVFSLKPTFVARSWSGNIKQMTEIIKAAVAHKGFSYVDILQACPTYNKFATHKWLMDHCYDASEEGHDNSDFEAARKITVDTSDRVSTGILYLDKKNSSFVDRLKPREGIKTTPVQEVKMQDVSKIMKNYI